MEEVRGQFRVSRGQMIMVRPCAALRAQSLIVSCRQSLVALTYASGSGILCRAAFVRLAGGCNRQVHQSNRTKWCKWHWGSCANTSPGSVESSPCLSTYLPWNQLARRSSPTGNSPSLSGTGVPARAIEEIMADTPVPIIMPCHGVVASDGIGGYSGGEPGRHVETKRWLLENEGALPPGLV
jgi:hypothetical protein